MDWIQKRQKKMMKFVHPKIQDQIVTAKRVANGEKIVDGGFNRSPIQPCEYPYVQCEGFTKNRKRCKHTGRWKSKFCLSHRNQKNAQIKWPEVFK